MGKKDDENERHDHSWFGERIQSDGPVETPDSEERVIILTDTPPCFRLPCGPSDRATP